MNLLNSVRVTRGINAMSSGAEPSGNELDMAGYEGVVYVLLGSSLMEGSGTVALKASGSTASSGSFVAYSSFAGSTAITTGNFNKKILCLDVYRPLKRYIKPVVVGCSSGAIHTRGIIAIQYGARTPGSTVMRDSTHIAAYATIVGATSS